MAELLNFFNIKGNLCLASSTWPRYLIDLTLEQVFSTIYKDISATKPELMCNNGHLSSIVWTSYKTLGHLSTSIILNLQKEIQNDFFVDFLVCSRNSLHVVFDNYNT